MKNPAAALATDLFLILICGFVPYYIYWLLAKKPHKRTKTYAFPLSGFETTIKQW